MSPKLKQEVYKPVAIITKQLQHWYSASFPYNTALIDEIRQMPGITWNSVHKHYRIPDDYLESFTKLLEPFHKIETNHKIDKPRAFAKQVCSVESKGTLRTLHPFQEEGVQKILKNHTYLLNYEMGLGKTPTVIIAARKAKALPILVICPALVRLNWVDEFDKWWPDHPPIGLVDTGDKAKKIKSEETKGKEIIITSYELARHFNNKKFELGTANFNFIILDECHYIKNKRAGRSKIIKEIRDSNTNAYIVGLSGTPITSEPSDLWNQLNTLRPGSFGTYWKFVQRYCNNIPNEYSEWVFKGLNSMFAEELRERLSCISSRVTKSEVADLLPPFTVLPLKIQVTKAKLKSIQTNRSTTIEINEELKRAGICKIDQAIEAIKNAYEQGQPVACLTWHRNVAKKIQLGISDDIRTVYVDGDVPIKQRVERIAVAKNTNSVLIGTIASVNVGIDLTYFSTAFIAELYSQPAAIIQALGRFSRLSGKVPSTCYILIAKGTYDEIISYVLKRRLKEQAQLFASGESEKGALRVLTEEEPEEDFFKELREAAAEMADPILD